MDFAVQLLRNPLFWTRLGAVFTCVGTLLLPISTNEKIAALTALGAMFGFGKADPQPKVLAPKTDERKG